MIGVVMVIGAKKPTILVGTKRKRRVSLVRGAVKRLLVIVLFLCLGAAGGVAVVFYYYSADLPSIGPLLEGYDPPQTTRILANDGTVLGELFEERRTVVPVARIPKIMINATIAVAVGPPPCTTRFENSHLVSAAGYSSIVVR